ncbi:hypothetical protein JCM21900_003449 [Sporobolomyces salmonicolor]
MDRGSTPLQARPSEEELLQEWYSIFSDPMLSLASLKRVAEDGKLLEKGLRSLAWRYFFSLLPPPSSLAASPSTSTATYSTHDLLLSRSRSEYTELRERYLRSPEGGWVKDGAENNRDGQGAASTKGSNQQAGGRPVKVDVKVNNPLGLDEDNPWQTWFQDLELRSIIRQDVQRTFPDVEYFRLASTQDRLTDLLFIYAKLNPEIGYRQGMHELLAPLLWTVDYDSLPPSRVEDDSLIHLVLARDWVEHDTWSLFCALMKSTSAFYDHTPSISIPGSAHDYATNFGLAPASPSTSATTLAQPIVAISAHLHSLIATLDPSLHAAFSRLQIEPQLYAIRWLRLLFSREFPLPDTLTLWDGLFARDPSLQLTEHIAAAMLLRIRDPLLQAERDGGYGEFLQVLLRYPTCPDGTFRTTLLLKQALYLRDNLSPKGAQYVRRQNVEYGVSLGGSAGDMDEALDLRSPSARQAYGHRKAMSGSPAPAASLLGEGGLVGDIAKGVYGRAEALGINKAIFGTFNDIRRGVAAAQAQVEEQRHRQRSSLSQIPSSPPWDPRPAPTPAATSAAGDATSDLVRMRASSLAMSNALDLCVSVFERALVPSSPAAPSTAFNALPRRPIAASQAHDDVALDDRGTKSTTESSTTSLAPQIMALTALKHIRDVLGGQAQSFDSNVLSPLRHALDEFDMRSPPALPTPPLISPSSPVPTPTKRPARPQPPTVKSEPAIMSEATAAPAYGPPTSTFPALQPAPSSLPAPLPPTPSSQPVLLLSARTDKPLPALSRTPSLVSRPSDPLSNGRASSIQPMPPSRPPPSSPLAPTPSPPRNPAWPSSSFSTGPAPPPSAKKPFDPLGAL